MIPRLLRALTRRTPLAQNFVGFDKYRKAGAYHWRELEVNPEYRELMDEVAKHMAPRLSVFDIGCGDGAYLGTLAGCFAKGVGIDAEGEAIRQARKQFERRGIHNCQVHHLRIDEARQHFASTSERFDLVWSMDVIEHLPQPDELLCLAQEVMAPGATLVLGTPLFIRPDLVSPYHVREFTAEEIRELLAARFDIKSESKIVQTRRDGQRYPDSYYVATCERRAIPNSTSR
ncbi:methyltransferase domain-containing protein [Ramlibacter sp. AW1]|uniref:Methyltransferase domain-containing protein n=1 Tax=Ramlibacter aurantiacus TaxID=2801330 RepID=A0A937D6Q8_9BURK|nr:class I SAM-dependent methyltransferase [Ramlibacter aurantiacus]MBL0421208.1 methyltransferase domain-containing protein [Ramlibacter aurantiacus]